MIKPGTHIFAELTKALKENNRLIDENNRLIDENKQWIEYYNTLTIEEGKENDCNS